MSKLVTQLSDNLTLSNACTQQSPAVWRCKATFTLKAVVLNSDLFLNLIFFVWLFTSGFFWSWSWTDPDVQKNNNKDVTRSTLSHKVNMEAIEVGVYGFIYKLYEQMIMTTRRKSDTFLIMAFCGAMAATSVRRCVQLSSMFVFRIVTNVDLEWR